MKRSLLMLVAVVAALGALAAGCGGSQEVPANAVAVVDGTEISSTELDALMEQAKASYTAGKRDFPKVGTPEYQSIQQQYVAFLVQKTQFEQAAADMGVEVTGRRRREDARAAQEGPLRRQRAEAQGRARGERPDRGCVPRDASGLRALRQALQGRHEGREGHRRRGAAGVHAEPRAVRGQAGVARGAPHPHLRAGQERPGRLHEEQGPGRRCVRAAEERCRLRGARQAVLDRPGLEGHGRQVHGESRSERPGVRRGRVQVEDGRDLEAGQDAVRLPHHPADSPTRRRRRRSRT